MNPELSVSLDLPAFLLLCEIILFFLLAPLIYFHNRRARENRLMAIILIFLALMLIPGPLNGRLRFMPAHMVYLTSPMAAFTITLFVIVCLALTRPGEKIPRFYYLGFLPTIYLAAYIVYVLLTPELFAKFTDGISFSGRRILRRPPLNAAGVIYTVYLLLAGGYGLWLLGRAALREKDLDNRRRIQFVLLSMLLYFPITIIANNLLPLLGNERYRDFAILTNVSAPLVVTWSFLRHKAWKVETLLDELREKQKLESSLNRARELDRVKTNFFTNVSHDLRTPLTLLIAPLERLLLQSRSGGENGGGFTPEQIRDLKRIHGGALKLSNLVNDLLDFSRAEAGAMEIRREATDLNALIRDIADDFAPPALERGLELRIVPPEDRVVLELDPAKTERILMNLVSNALKFTREGHVAIRVEVRDERVLIRVEDTGPGIPADKQEEIFRKYERLTDEGTGTGIGLALAREFAELQEGSLTAAPRPGGGSVFTLNLPYLPAEPGAIVPRARRRLPRESLRTATDSADHFAEGDSEHSSPHQGTPPILVVEDHPELREFLRELLSDSFRVIAAAGGEEALELFRVDRPRLVLSDIMLPGMDGLELLRAIKRDPEGARVPIILLSARSGLRERLRGLDLEADDYIEKPFAPEELLVRIRNLLRKEKAVAESLAHVRRIILDDLHDHLGARLTDLAIAVERFTPAGSAPDMTRDLARRFQALNTGFRDWLSSLEDMDILRQDFMDGIHLILIRRYSSAGRSIEFKTDEAARELSRDALNENGRRNLLSIIVEIVTNDLRYGQGESLWCFRAGDANQLVLVLETHSLYQGSGGRGTNNLKRRVELMRGSIREERAAADMEGIDGAGGPYRLEIIVEPGDPVEAPANPAVNA